MNTIELQKTRAAAPLTLLWNGSHSHGCCWARRSTLPQVLADAVKASRAEIVTVSVRRESAGGNAVNGSGS